VAHTWHCELRAIPCPRPIVTRNGRRTFMGATYNAWKHSVYILAPNRYTPPPLRVTIELHEWKKRADLDNTAKSILDALTLRFWPNDNATYIQDLRIFCGAPGEGFTVTVEQIEEVEV
jgi:Holliday junction resolvase RusA-like endonuclease